MSEILRIVIAEDHHAVREGFKRIIDAEDDMQIIAEASDGRTAVELARELQPDVLVMDLSMPELSGLLAAAKLNRVAPDVKILILTRHSDGIYLQETMQAGVCGFILKQSAPDELLRAVRAVASGNKYLDPVMSSKIFNVFSENATKLRGDIHGVPLTARESDIMRDIALGYSNSEIAEKLKLSVKTVEAHKANSMKKLDLKSRRDIVSYAILQGWMHEE